MERNENEWKEELMQLKFEYVHTTTECDSIVLPMKWANDLYSLNHRSVSLSLSLGLSGLPRDRKHELCTFCRSQRDLTSFVSSVKFPNSFIPVLFVFHGAFAPSFHTLSHQNELVILHGVVSGRSSSAASTQ